LDEDQAHTLLALFLHPNQTAKASRTNATNISRVRPGAGDSAAIHFARQLCATNFNAPGAERNRRPGARALFYGCCFWELMEKGCIKGKAAAVMLKLDFRCGSFIINRW
jgi:hypothetical protein